MKKIITAIFLIIFTLFLGIFSFLQFMNYGGNNCDMKGNKCDCFCCNSFGLRGYESCAYTGLIIGIISGIFISFIIYKIIFNKRKK